MTSRLWVTFYCRRLEKSLKENSTANFTMAALWKYNKKKYFQRRDRRHCLLRKIKWLSNIMKLNVTQSLGKTWSLMCQIVFWWIPWSIIVDVTCPLNFKSYFWRRKGWIIFQTYRNKYDKQCQILSSFRRLTLLPPLPL